MKKCSSPNNRVLENTTVIKVIKRMITEKNNDFVYELSPGAIVYRSREITAEELNNPNTSLYTEVKDKKTRFIGFDKYDSKEPPLSFSRSGRNNIQGASYIYVAEDAYTACAEIRPKLHSFISLAQFRINKPMRLFDVTGESTISKENYADIKPVVDTIRVISRLMFQFTIPVYNSADYYPSQYIADYIRKAGFDGIRYRSMYSSGYCYTLFNCGKQSIEFLSSEILLSRVPVYYLYRLNDHTKIIPPDKLKNDIEISENNLKIIKNRVCQQLPDKPLEQRSQNGKLTNENPGFDDVNH